MASGQNVSSCDPLKIYVVPYRSLSVKIANEFKAKLSSEFNNEENEIDIVEIHGYCRQIAERKSLLTILSLQDLDETSEGNCSVEETILAALKGTRKAWK